MGSLFVTKCVVLSSESCLFCFFFFLLFSFFLRRARIYFVLGLYGMVSGNDSGRGVFTYAATFRGRLDQVQGLRQIDR